MTVFATIAFAAFLLENDYLVTFNEGGSYFAYHLGAFYGRSTYFHCAVGVNEEHAVKLYCLAFFHLFAEIVNIQEAVLFCLELLTLNFYNNVHYNV